jgi:hypothetical protein
MAIHRPAIGDNFRLDDTKKYNNAEALRSQAHAKSFFDKGFYCLMSKLD